MTSFFSKPLNTIEIDDIHKLIEEQYPEGDFIDFKQELPSKNNRPDPWLNGDTKISDYARNSLLKEIVAFANSQGGYLIVGIEESNDKPSRANGIRPIPKCADLAEKLRLQVRDCISPQLPIIQTLGVKTENDGSGIVIVQVEQSRLAPHRLEPTAQCYFRRNDRSEKMTMREIQELTIQRRQHMLNIDAEFVQRQKDFQKQVEVAFKGNPCRGIRVTLIPVSSDIWIDRIDDKQGIKPIQKPIPYSVGIKRLSFDSLTHFATYNNKPILRGRRFYGDRSDYIVQQEIYCNGLIEYTFVVKDKNEDRQIGISPEWVMSFAINAMLTANKFRVITGFTSTEYGLEIEIRGYSCNLQINQYSPAQRVFNIEQNPLLLPRISFGSIEELNNIINLLHRDLWDSANVESIPVLKVQIPEDE